MSNKPPNIRPQRNRQNMPSGFVIGRRSSGRGHEELIPFGDLARAVSATGQVQAGTQLDHAFVGFQAEGPFAANQYFPLSMAVVNASFPAEELQDQGLAVFPATADTDFFLTNDLLNFLFDGSNLLCTVTFAAGETEPTFAWEPSTLVNQGDILYVVCDSTPDPTLAGVQIVFGGDIV